MWWLVLTLICVPAIAFVIQLPRRRSTAAPGLRRRRRAPSVIPVDARVAEHAEALRNGRR